MNSHNTRSIAVPLVLLLISYFLLICGVFILAVSLNITLLPLLYCYTAYLIYVSHCFSSLFSCPTLTVLLQWFD